MKIDKYQIADIFKIVQTWDDPGKKKERRDILGREKGVSPSKEARTMRICRELKQMGRAVM